MSTTFETKVDTLRLIHPTIAEVDAEGHRNKYLRRNLDGVVDNFTEHTDDAVLYLPSGAQ